MDDEKIIELYFSRSEDAIHYTHIKYGQYCLSIALNVLNDFQDSEECVNDTYLHTWNSIPPARPNNFKAFLGKITRNLSINRLKAKTANKRKADEYAIAYDELDGLFNSNYSTDEQVDDIFLRDLINDFLSKLPKESRIIFVARYWYFEPVLNISQKLNVSESKVKMTLLRTRNALKSYLEKEGVSL